MKPDDELKVFGHYAGSDEEAQRRFELYKSRDPFPEIEPALLNSADICDYVRMTGMIWPFYDKAMKSASYEMRLLGKQIFWDEYGNQKEKDINDGDKICLLQNSIIFVTPEPKFRLPDYIALRFNLRITQVHRGLLLGTGPLVDPGYEGQLLIPLHNLTANKYIMSGGEGFIWVEFTKLSKNPRWDSKETNKRYGQYSPFKETKKNLPVATFIKKALEGQAADSILSSIPVAMKEAKDSAIEAASLAKEAQLSAKNSSSSADKTQKYSFWSGIVVAAVAIIAAVALVCQVFSFVNDANNYMKSQVTADLNTLRELIEKDLKSANEKIEKLDKRLQDIEKPQVMTGVSSPAPSAAPVKRPEPQKP
jgi:deoxycytidine triphosphate deaminase